MRVPRSDGIVAQSVWGGDMHGYQEESLVPNRQEADAAVQTLAALTASSAERSGDDASPAV
jgi:hypothetical protein